MEQGQAVFLSCFLFAGINPTGKFPKRPWIREYGSLAKQVFGSVLFDRDRKGAIYIRRELQTFCFEFNWKNILLAKRVGTNIGRATAKTYNGDRHFHNVRYR